MKILGNIIWLIFGGLHTAIEYFIAEHEAGRAGYLALRLEGKVEGVAAGLSKHVHECAVVFRWRHLDLSHPHLLRPAALYHHHRHSLGKDAFPLSKAGPVTIRHEGRIAYEQR